MPLLWALEVVKYCPHHRCPLQFVCPCCAKPQPFLGQCCPIGFCTRCKKWLGVEGTLNRGDEYSFLRSEAPDWEVWAATQVEEMIRAAFDSPVLLNRQQLSQLMWAATNAEGLSSFSRMLGVSPTSMTSWRSGAKLPMLPVYLRIARALNVTLTQLMTGKVTPDSIHSLDALGIPYWRNIRIRNRPTFDLMKAKRQLCEALQQAPPLSLTAFRKRTGYHYDTLQKHFPDLCTALCERFRQHQIAIVQERHEDKIAEFRAIAHRLHQEGIDLFVHRVLKRMSVPLSLDYRVACALLTDVKAEILAREQTNT